MDPKFSQHTPLLNDLIPRKRRKLTCPLRKKIVVGRQSFPFEMPLCRGHVSFPGVYKKGYEKVGFKGIPMVFSRDWLGVVETSLH